MKRAISILVLLILTFICFEFGVNFLKKGHEVSYQVYVNDKVFKITEIYQKTNGNTYDIKIESDTEVFNYVIENNYNKQKKIIKKIEYFNENNNSCIYPILDNDEGTYLECFKDNKLYTSSSFYDQNFINNIKASLKEKGYQLTKEIDITNVKEYQNTTVYTNNIIDNDLITLWTYKGIRTFTKKDSLLKNILSFDKYENNHGYLVDKYYIIPSYLSSKVTEFSKVNVINLETKTVEQIDLVYTLSSDTYINGVVDNKLYYTDPSNLLQIEINPKKKTSRLIGSKDLNGQIYNGSWESINIYDFVSNKLLFKKEIPNINYSYKEIIEGKYSYYFYNDNGEVYQISKNSLESPILLFKVDNINNFNVVDDTIYYVADDTLYYYSNEDGIVPILKNNDLRYNTTNRISIYRKS